MNMHDGYIFALFDRNDYERLDNILLDLFQKGYEVKDAHDVASTDELETLISQCRVVMLFITRTGLYNQNVLYQIQLADRFDKQIVPFFLDDPTEYYIDDNLKILFDGASRIDAYQYADNTALIQKADFELGKYYRNEKKKRPFKTVAITVLIILAAVAAISFFTNRGVDTQTLRDATVMVYCEGEDSASTGSGFFVNKNGTIITNYHVVEGSESIAVKLNSGDDFYTAEWIDEDIENDLAVLKIKGNAASLSFAVLKFSTKVPQVGDRCYASGYPKGIDLIVSDGIVSNSKHTAKEEDGSYSQYFTVTAAVSAGNSGGPLVDERGRVIGIITARYTEATNIGLAKPAVYAKDLLEKYD